MTKDEGLRLALEALEKTQSALARCMGPHKSEEGDRHRALAYSRTTISAIKAALEAKDEPEYYGLTKDHLWMSISKEHYDRLKPEFRMVCYTTPPQRTWVGLTDEEKQEWIDAMPSPPEPRHFMVLVNAIESELKEKNS